MASAYGDVCQVADTPLPPFVTVWADFRQNVTLTGSASGGHGSLSLTYTDANTGTKSAPVLFFDASLPR
jgi:hypothetical protein